MIRIGYAPGAYDLFHIGHLNLLRQAKEHCDFLIAGVVADDVLIVHKGMKPVVPLAERLEIVRNVRYVAPTSSRDGTRFRLLRAAASDTAGLSWLAFLLPSFLLQWNCAMTEIACTGPIAQSRRALRRRDGTLAGQLPGHVPRTANDDHNHRLDVSLRS